MGRRKSAAKTGDKKLYSRRQEEGADSLGAKEQASDDYFHGQRDESFLALERATDAEEDSSDGQFEHRQSVLDLGASGESSDEEDKSDGGSEEGEQDRYRQRISNVNAENSDASSLDDSSVDDDDENLGEHHDSVRNWGRKKSSYYSGDTGDLELGQDEEDAFVEGEAAKEIQMAQFGKMDQSDFELQVENTLEKMSTSNPTNMAVRERSKMGLKEKRRLLRLQHSEVIPISAFVLEISKVLMSNTGVATRALLKDSDTIKSVGASMEGQLFLLTKSMMEQSISLNAALYLLLKSCMVKEGIEEGLGGVDSHPVMQQLGRANSLIDRFGDFASSIPSNLEDQIKNLVRAASLMEESTEETLDDQRSAMRIARDHKESNPGCEKLVACMSDVVKERNVSRKNSDGSQLSKGVLDVARFGLRQHEVDLGSRVATRRRVPRFSDLGDAENEGEASAAFAGAINSIDQRAAKKQRKALLGHSSDPIDQVDDAGLEVAEGLRLIENGLQERSEQNFAAEFDEAPEEGMESENVDELDGMQFYNEMATSAKKRKEVKQKMYQVAAKFPTSENEVTGERAVNRVMLKNRGLVAHKSKINRNPRVKKRMQYRKALIRRKGAVRDVRTQENHRYEGEETGIKSRLSRSRKLTS